MPLYEHSFRAMGCPCRLRLECDDGALAQAAIAAAEAEVRRLEEKYSRYLPDSLTTRINRNAGGEPVAIDPETAGLLGFAHTLWEQSDGRFDLTAGILRRAWDFRSGKLPSQVAIDRLLPLIGWQQVQWSADTIRLPQRGMEIDFGGCVKEYASDSAAGLLADHGIRRALVDLGGDIAVSGAACRASPWPVGIRHPRARGEALAGILLAAGGLASSGDYERCLIVEGRRYGHIQSRNGVAGAGAGGGQRAGRAVPGGRRQRHPGHVAGGGRGPCLAGGTGPALAGSGHPSGRARQAGALGHLSLRPPRPRREGGTIWREYPQGSQSGTV